MPELEIVGGCTGRGTSDVLLSRLLCERVFFFFFLTGFGWVSAIDSGTPNVPEDIGRFARGETGPRGDCGRWLKLGNVSESFPDMTEYG